jgi:hypothetical protein
MRIGAGGAVAAAGGALGAPGALAPGAGALDGSVPGAARGAAQLATTSALATAPRSTWLRAAAIRRAGSRGRGARAERELNDGNRCATARTPRRGSGGTARRPGRQCSRTATSRPRHGRTRGRLAARIGAAARRVNVARAGSRLRGLEKRPRAGGVPIRAKNAKLLLATIYRLPMAGHLSGGAKFVAAATRVDAEDWQRGCETHR